MTPHIRAEKGDFAEAKKSPAFLVWEKKRPLTEALRLSPEGGLTLAEEEEAASATTSNIG